MEFEKQVTGDLGDTLLLSRYFCVALIFSSKRVLFDILKSHKEKPKGSDPERASQGVGFR